MRVSLLFPLALVGLVVAAGCDNADGAPKEDGGGAAATGSGGSTTGEEAGGSDGGGVFLTPEEKYDTVDEGAFPKDRVLDIQVSMKEGDWDRLIATAAQETWSTADVTIDGQRVGTVGIRPKGEYSLDSCIVGGTLVCDKLSLKLKFNGVNPDGRFYGLKKLVLNNIVDAGTIYSETLAYQLYNDFGVTAPRTSYAVVTVDGESLGLYRVVEPIDGRFTARRFPEGGDGNLYKEAWPDRTERFYFANALETNEETATHDAFIGFATAMLAANDQNLPETLAQYMDLDQVIHYMAVDYAIANWDGITTFYAGSWGKANHNYYMYQQEGGTKFTLIPWDLNATFFLEHWLGDIQPWDTLDADCDTMVPTRDDASLFTVPPSCDPMIRAIALSKDKYHAAVRRLLDEVFVLDKLNQQVDAYREQVTSAVANDPFLYVGDAIGGAEYIKGQLEILRARLEGVVAGDVAH